MLALQFDGKGLNLGDVPVPSNEGEALVRVVRSGICNTDIEISRGYAGFTGTIGHEFVGIVEGSRNPDLVGKRVVGEINAGCGDCEVCATGDERHCPQRTVLGIVGRDGCHAEFLNLPERNLLAVPDSITDEEAVFAEPLAAAYGIAEQVSISPETKVAVIGDGKLGILCAWSLAREAQHLYLIGKHQSKLLKAETDVVEGVLLENVSKLSWSFDVVVEASGSESGFATALDLVRPRGKIVLKSTFEGKPSIEAWRVVVDEITIVGSRCGRMAPALELLGTGAVPVSRLVSGTMPLKEGVEAMSVASRPGVVKILLEMQP